ncbi:MAG: MaoC/PaaZ C-terminal domain-containing protein [Dongiaceae bacterium]
MTSDFSGDLSGLGRLRKTQEFRVNTVRLAQFAAAIDDENPRHLEGAVASPIFANVPPMQPTIEVLRAVTPAFAFHGQHDFHYHRAIRPGMRLFSQATLRGAIPSAAGVSIMIKAETLDETGALVDEQYFTALVAGAKLDKPVGEAAPDHRLPEAARAAAPIATATYPMAADQTARYADAARDYSAYTLRLDAAKALGFEHLLVHGMLTMAFAGRAIVEHACGGDVDRLKRLAGRFSAPVFLTPGQAITTRIWRLEGKGGRQAFGYEASEASGNTVIKHGLAEVA